LPARHRILSELVGASRSRITEHLSMFEGSTWFRPTIASSSPIAIDRKVFWRKLIFLLMATNSGKLPRASFALTSI